MRYPIYLKNNLIKNFEDDYYDFNPNTNAFYEIDYILKNPSLHYEDSENKFTAIKYFIPWLLRNTQIKTILDIGCGSCHVISKLLDYLINHVDSRISAIGLDISSQILIHSVKHTNLIKIRSDCYTIPLESNSITLSLCIDIIEHLDNPQKMFDEVARISEYAILKVPLELSLYTFIKGGKKRLEHLNNKFGHLNHYNRKKLIRILKPKFIIIQETYAIIPNLKSYLDYIQRMLLKFKLLWLFKYLFGGFIMILVKSK